MTKRFEFCIVCQLKQYRKDVKKFTIDVQLSTPKEITLCIWCLDGLKAALK